MSLATRCSSCGTVFRVVQDQLKVSEGWVRCGRCNEVFNALEGLFDLDREAPPEWEPDDREEWAKQPAAGTPADPDEGEASEASDPQLVDKIDAELFGQREHEPGMVGSPGVVQGIRDEEAPPADRFAIGHDGADDDEPPDFLRRADRAARWQRPWVRASLGACSVLLLAALGLQTSHHFRDEVAARWPEVAPALTSWCDWLGCSVASPRHIDAVAVESTALSRTGTSEVYRLSVVLRNHGGLPVAMPSVDLALTDATGQLIARRALSRNDFIAAPATVAAGGDATLQTSLSAGGTKITGYTVEVFYP
jgi:predicted Zn finger-like uncharacterized protein